MNAPYLYYASDSAGKKHKGFYLCALGLCVTAVPLFTDGGGICGVLGPALVLSGVLWNGLGQPKAKSERKPLSKMKVIQLCCQHCRNEKSESFHVHLQYLQRIGTPPPHPFGCPL